MKHTTLQIKRENEMTKKKLKLLAYCRVSTQDQNLENQRRSINAYLEYHEKYEVVKWYEEKVSAFKQRKQFQNLQTDLHNEKADGIIVQRLDRIGRSVHQLSNMINKMDQHNKKFIASEQNINTNTIEGRLLANILMAIAQFEAELFKERSREGRERYISEGNHWGRPKKEIEPIIKRRIIGMYNSGIGTTIIAKVLNSEGIKISPSTVWRRLKSWNIETRPPNIEQ